MRSFTSALLCGLLPASVFGLSLDWTLNRQVLSNTWGKPVITVNGTWPIPEVRVPVGEVVTITVINENIAEGVTLHGHGLHQQNNNQDDGPEGITQCPVYINQTYTYTWKADVAGTYWIHSHKVAQYPQGLRTPFIVYDNSEPSTYGYDADKDLLMDLSDWWFDDQSTVDNTYKSGTCCVRGDSSNCGLEVPPDTAIVRDQINGQYTYNLPSAPTQGVRIRLINMSGFSSFIVFASDPAINLKIIEADAVALRSSNPPSAKSVEIHAGQRYSLLITGVTSSFRLYAALDPYQNTKNSCGQIEPPVSPATMNWNNAQIAKVDFLINNVALAPYAFPSPGNECQRSTEVLCYVEDPTLGATFRNLPSHASDLTQRANDEWYFSNLQPRNAQSSLVWNDADSVFYDLTLDAAGPGKTASLNGVQFSGPKVPVLLRETLQPATCSGANLVQQTQPMYGRSFSSYYGGPDDVKNPYRIPYGKKVFLRVTSTIGAHPFHLHGYDFQVLYHQPETRPSTSVGNWDLNRFKQNGYSQPTNPLRRDTLHISSKTYSLIAFTATNPGAWIFHCHNDFHAMSGMAGVLVVQPNPSDTTNWVPSAVGQYVFNQCHFKTASNGAFPDWQRPCCNSATQTCPVESQPVCAATTCSLNAS